MTLSKFKILLFTFLLAFSCFAQQKAPRLFSENLMEKEIDSLRNQWAYNKFFYEKYELPTLVALSFYPELKNTTISFRRKKLKSTMAARPKGFSVFQRKGERHYIVYINDFPSVKVSPDSVSFNAQIGVIGHELAHIVEYEQMASVKIIYTGLAYFNKKFKARFERATDQRTIDHGLLWQCYDFATYVHTSKNTSQEYLEYKRKFYMSPEEIKGQVD